MNGKIEDRNQTKRKEFEKYNDELKEKWVMRYMYDFLFGRLTDGQSVLINCLSARR